MRRLLYRGLLALSAWSLALSSSAAVAPPPSSSIKVPWGEIFTALQESNLGAEDMKDLQGYMQERIRAQQARQRRRQQQQPAAAAASAAAAAAQQEEGGGDDPPPALVAAEEEEGEGEGEFDWKATLAAFKDQARVLDRSVALRKAGNERLAAGDVEGARASYREALTVLEEGTVVATGRTRRCNHSCRLNLAVAATREGDLAGARAAYGEILAEGPESVEPAVRLQCWAKRARISRRLGEVEAALADLVEANRLKPSDAKIREELEELGGTPVAPPPPRPPVASPFDALLSGEGGLGAGAGAGGGLFGEGLLSGLGAAGAGAGSGGAGGGGPDLLGGLLASALGSGAGGGAGGGGGGSNPLEHMVGDYITSMGSRLVDLLDEPQTLQMVCTMAKRLEPSYLRSLAQTANLPVGDGTIDWLHKKATSLEPEDLRRWVSRGKFAHRTYSATRRTWTSVKPLLGPMRLAAMYLMVLRWVVACLYH